jgi:hypothetical protein
MKRMKRIDRAEKGREDRGVHADTNLAIQTKEDTCKQQQRN